MYTSHSFLPINREDMQQRGWDALDIVLISGDAYVDHPSFGTALIGRLLEAQGYRVGILAMPDWNDPASVTQLGKPRLFFGISSGNVDSMIARYTAFKRYRSDDPYVPGGKAGRKPERAVLVYCNLVKAAYKDIPIVLGGVEASMRRVAHYDFWSNKVRRSILEDSRADILVYGMGEQAITDIAARLQKGARTSLQLDARAHFLEGIRGTVLLSRDCPEDASLLPAEEDVMATKATFVEFYRQFYRRQHKTLAQVTGKRFILHYPAGRITSQELDAIYDLPFTRKPHPSYTQRIPAFGMIRSSVTSHRGCVSGCSFCSLGLHQGKRIVSRSPESVLHEVEKIASETDFTGHITDIGGPSANMYALDCQRDWNCTCESCLFPALCPNLILNTRAWLRLLQRASQMPQVKHVTIGSGLRYDLLMREPDHKRLLKAFIAKHISGQLKIAPEHTESKILRAMRKVPLFGLKQFITECRAITQALGKRQYILPYLMSCHPGTSLKDMQNMKAAVQSLFGFIPEQAQAFIPLPMTLSSVIYHTGIDPLTGEHFDVVRDINERRKQHQAFSAGTHHQRPQKRKKRR